MGWNQFDWVLPGCTEFYWVLLGFTEFSMGFPKLDWVWSSLTRYWILSELDFAPLGFYWILLGFTGFFLRCHWIGLSLAGFFWAFHGFYWLLDRFLLSFSWLLSSFTGFHQVLPSFDDLVWGFPWFRFDFTDHYLISLGSTNNFFISNHINIVLGFRVLSFILAFEWLFTGLQPCLA